MPNTLNAWRDLNPLRAWRSAGATSMMRAAAALGVSIPSIQAWEYGISRPTRENLAKIGTLIGSHDIEGEWQKWESKRPAEVTA